MHDAYGRVQAEATQREVVYLGPTQCMRAYQAADSHPIRVSRNGPAHYTNHIYREADNHDPSYYLRTFTRRMQNLRKQDRDDP